MNQQILMSFDLPYNPSLFTLKVEEFSSKYTINLINNEESITQKNNYIKELNYNKQFSSSFCTLYKKKDGSIYKKNTSYKPNNRNYDYRFNNQSEIYLGYKNSYDHEVIDFYIEIQLDIDFLIKK